MASGKGFKQATLLCTVFGFGVLTRLVFCKKRWGSRCVQTENIVICERWSKKAGNSTNFVFTHTC